MLKIFKILTYHYYIECYHHWTHGTVYKNTHHNTIDRECNGVFLMQRMPQNSHSRFTQSFTAIHTESRGKNRTSGQSDLTQCKAVSLNHVRQVAS